jgi:hypothetical protein
VAAQSRLLAITKADPETTLSPRLAEVGVRLYGAWGAGAWVQQVLLTALRDTTAAQ